MTSRLEEVLSSRPLMAVEWGLDRTREILRRLDHPQRAFRAVHVGGTNGKGSTAAMVASVLARAGYRTGLYTSPELLEFRDRFRVDGEPLPRPLLDACAGRVGPLARETDATFFEAATALAFLAFREAGAEWAAVEVGMGGRLDATNVLEPDVAAVVSVSMEHAEHLGDTLEAVAGEKAGILKPGVPGVAGELPAPALRVLEARAGEVGAPLAVLGRDAEVDVVATDLSGTSFRYRSPRWPAGKSFRIPLVGEHQARNAAVALMALERIPSPPPEAAVAEGLATVEWRGRFECLRRADGPWVLDVAHNAAGMTALTETLAGVEVERPLVAVVAALRDKDPRMLDPLGGSVSRLVLTVAPSTPAGRAWDPEGVAAGLGGLPVEVERDFGGALARGRELAGEGTVVVSGSCYTVADALRRLEGRRDDVGKSGHEED